MSNDNPDPRSYKPALRAQLRRLGRIPSEKAPAEIARNFKFMQLMLDIPISEVANVLNVSLKSAYGKLDGTSPLYMDEADILRSFFSEWRKNKVQALEEMEI